MKPISPQQLVTILVVEDDQGDLLAIQEGLKKHKIANAVVTAKDGLEALEILRGDKGREPLAKPYIIFLDLNTPRVSGFEFLNAIRDNPDLKSTVVFVLVHSKADKDRPMAYTSNVAGVIVKTDAGRGFLTAVELLGRDWQVVKTGSDVVVVNLTS